MLSFLEENPLPLIAVMATLPVLGLPSSPVLVLFGVVIVTHCGMPEAVLLAIAAQTLCSIWTYALSSGRLKVFAASLCIAWTNPTRDERT